MVRIACDLYQFAVFYVVEEGARIRTILGADASDYTSFADVAGQ
jgi:hypothetical protein